MTLQEYITKYKIKLPKDRGSVEMFYFDGFGIKEVIKLQFVSKKEFECLSVLHDYLTINKDVNLPDVYKELASNKKLKEYFSLIKQSSMEETFEILDKIRSQNPMDIARKINSRRKLDNALKNDEKLRKNRVFLGKEKDEQ